METIFITRLKDKDECESCPHKKKSIKIVTRPTYRAGVYDKTGYKIILGFCEKCVIDFQYKIRDLYGQVTYKARCGSCCKELIAKLNKTQPT